MSANDSFPSASNSSNTDSKDGVKKYPLEEYMSLAQAEAVKEAKILQERAAEFRVQATRLRALHREQAQGLDRQAQQLDINAKAATELNKTLNFESILLRLRRNDPMTVHLNGEYDLSFPSGYGKALGQALQMNTVVSKIEIDFPAIFSLDLSDDDNLNDDLTPLVQFVQTRKSLHDFGLYAPEDVALLKTYRAAQRLLTAMLANSQVEIARFMLHVPQLEFYKLLKNGNVQVLDANIIDANDYMDHECDTVASAFQVNRTLKSLTLTVARNDDLMVQILSNLRHSKLQELVLTADRERSDEYFNAIVPALQHYLSTATTLRRLELSDFEFLDSEMARLLIGLTHQIPQNNDGSVVPTLLISELALTDCVPSTDLLGEFLQRPITTTPNGEAVFQSHLRTLEVVAGGQATFSRNIAEGLFMATLPSTATPLPLSSPSSSSKSSDGISQVLPPPLPFGSSTGTLLSTIGSQLHTLRFGAVHSRFFKCLGKNAHRVRLQELHLEYVSRPAGMNLSKCLPKLRSLRKLTLDGLNRDAAPWVVRGLKRNGSICSFVDPKEYREDAFDAAQLRLIQAYCDRNQALAAMRAGSKHKLYESGTIASVQVGVEHLVPSSDTKDDNDISVSATTSTRDSDYAAAVADQRLRTSLFQVVQQVPSDAVDVVVRGLLMNGECCVDPM